jgi:hypothetical protein
LSPAIEDRNRRAVKRELDALWTPRQAMDIREAASQIACNDKAMTRKFRRVSEILPTGSALRIERGEKHRVIQAAYPVAIKGLKSEINAVEGVGIERLTAIDGRKVNGRIFRSTVRASFHALIRHVERCRGTAGEAVTSVPGCADAFDRILHAYALCGQDLRLKIGGNLLVPSGDATGAFLGYLGVEHIPGSNDYGFCFYARTWISEGMMPLSGPQENAFRQVLAYIPGRTPPDPLVSAMEALPKHGSCNLQTRTEYAETVSAPPEALPSLPEQRLSAEIFSSALCADAAALAIEQLRTLRRNPKCRA